jgi:hypothetical protein
MGIGHQSVIQAGPSYSHSAQRWSSSRLLLLLALILGKIFLIFVYELQLC